MNIDIHLCIKIYICIHTRTHPHTHICIYTAVMCQQSTFRQHSTRFPRNSASQQNLLASVNCFHVPPKTCKSLQIQHMFTPKISCH